MDVLRRTPKRAAQNVGYMPMSPAVDKVAFIANLR
jgi:hypothetical protein